MLTTLLTLFALSAPADAHPRHHHPHNVRREHQFFRKHVFIYGQGWVLKIHARWVPGHYAVVRGERRWIPGRYVYSGPKRAR